MHDPGLSSRYAHLSSLGPGPPSSLGGVAFDAAGGCRTGAAGACTDLCVVGDPLGAGTWVDRCLPRAGLLEYRYARPGSAITLRCPSAQVVPSSSILNRCCRWAVTFPNLTVPMVEIRRSIACSYDAVCTGEPARPVPPPVQLAQPNASGPAAAVGSCEVKQVTTNTLLCERRHVRERHR